MGVIQSNDTLIVGEKGIVNANISAGCVLIRGEVVGNVLATEATRDARDLSVVSFKR